MTGVCQKCEKPLVGRQRKWCSKKCSHGVANAKYQKTEKGRRAKVRYLRTEKGQQAQSKSELRYKRTEKGRQVAQRKDNKSRARGDKKAGVWAELSRDEWQFLYHKQGGVCPICLIPLRDRYDPKGGTIANLDHDHKIEKASGLRASLRGLLCRWCNKKTLVAVRDNAATARRVADYLDDPPAPRHIALDCPRPGPDPNRALEIEGV